MDAKSRLILARIISGDKIVAAVPMKTMTADACPAVMECDEQIPILKSRTFNLAWGF